MTPASDTIISFVHLPSLHGQRDHQEDAGAVGEVADALEDGEDEVDVDEVVGEIEVDGQDKKVGAEEEDVGGAERGEKVVEHTPREPEGEDDDGDDVPHQPQPRDDGGHEASYPPAASCY